MIWSVSRLAHSHYSRLAGLENLHLVVRSVIDEHGTVVKTRPFKLR